jgi:hypothetical protein
MKDCVNERSQTVTNQPPDMIAVRFNPNLNVEMEKVQGRWMPERSEQ